MRHVTVTGRKKQNKNILTPGLQNDCRDKRKRDGRLSCFANSQLPPDREAATQNINIKQTRSSGSAASPQLIP